MLRFDEVGVIPVTFLQLLLALLLGVLHGVTTTHVPVWSRKPASWALVVADKVDVGGKAGACDGHTFLEFDRLVVAVVHRRVPVHEVCKPHEQRCAELRHG